MRKLTFIGLLLVTCLFFFELPSLTTIASRNRIFSLYVQFQTRQLQSEDERIRLLRSISQVSEHSTNGFSPRQSILVDSIDRILNQIEFDGGLTCADTQAIPLSAQLPYPISLGNGLQLLQVDVLSGSGDYAAGSDLTVRIKLGATGQIRDISGLHVDAIGWQSYPFDAQIIACGKLPNLIEDAGYEYPAFIPPILPGVLDPVRWWGAGPDGWTLLSKREGIDGESICVSKTRFAPPMNKVKQGQWFAFGGYFHGDPYPITPYLVVIDAENPANVPVMLEPSVKMNGDDSDWHFAYGVVQAPVDGYVTLYVDGWQNPDSRTCLDNVFIILLPNVSLAD